MVAGFAAWWWSRPTAVPVAPRPDLVAPTGVPALPDAVASATTVVVAWAAQAGAMLEPCGCAAGMQGGLVRRASLLARLPSERRLTLEGGGWSGGAASYQLLRAGWFLRGLGLVGTDAVGIGTAEVRLGAATLAALVRSPGAPPVVCANVPGFTSAVLVERGGIRWCLTSVAPVEASGPGLQASDPAQGLLSVLAAHPGTRVVVLADLDDAGLTRLAREIPGLALVVGGAVHHPSSAPLAVGPARVVFSGNAGKTLGWWPWGGDACAFELINDTVPDHPTLRTLVAGYQDAVAALDIDLDPRFAGLTALGSGHGHFVGDAACMSCHADAGRVHAASRHTHALDTLVAKGYGKDPDCLRCHVTGMGLPGGFRRDAPTPGVDRVGCESCHGRGSQHSGAGGLAAVTPATCVRCHDRDNSPAFSHETYWPRIRHGR